MATPNNGYNKPIYFEKFFPNLNDMDNDYIGKLAYALYKTEIYKSYKHHPEQTDEIISNYKENITTPEKIQEYRNTAAEKLAVNASNLSQGKVDGIMEMAKKSTISTFIIEADKKIKDDWGTTIKDKCIVAFEEDRKKSKPFLSSLTASILASIIALIVSVCLTLKFALPSVEDTIKKELLTNPDVEKINDSTYIFHNKSY